MTERQLGTFLERIAKKVEPKFDKYSYSASAANSKWVARRVSLTKAALRKHGYDSIPYINAVEGGKGSISWIHLKPNTVFSTTTGGRIYSGAGAALGAGAAASGAVQPEQPEKDDDFEKTLKMFDED